MRIDKYIWCVRLVKTRSIGSKACQGDKVKLNEELCKGSKTVKVGDRIALRHNPIWKSYRVLGIPKSRVSAKLIPDLLIETTDEMDLELLQQVQESNRQSRIMGFRGRPTKRDRRKWDDLFD